MKKYHYLYETKHILFHCFLALKIHSNLTYTTQRWKIMFIAAYL